MGTWTRFVLGGAFSAAALASGGMLLSAPQIIAHRGASFEAPENTLGALRLGFAQGADAGECDVRQTRDGHVVLLHDASTLRTTGVDLFAAAHDLADLRRLDAGAWKGTRWAGEKIPTLAEAIALLAASPPGRRLVIEIKSGPAILPEIARLRALAKEIVADAQLVVIAFDRAVAAGAKRLLPSVEVHQLASWKKDPATGAWPRLETLVANARADGLDGLNLESRFPVDEAFVETVHAAGLKLCVWTVDDPALARRLAAAGVDAITTNRPGWLRAQLAF